MIAPDSHTLHVIDVFTGFLCQLRHCTIVVEASHRGEVTRVNVGCIAACDQSIGIRRIADHQYPNVTTGVIVNRFALYREDLCICFKQVLAFHAGATRARTDQQRVVTVVECHIRIVSSNDAGQCWKRTIVEFHHHALQRRKCGRNFEQL